MSYTVEYTHNFLREFKKLQKKSKTLIDELEDLCDLLEKEPQTGQFLGKGFYKIRLKGPNRGKRSSYRVITYILTEENIVKLVAIYSKSEKTNILREDLEQIIHDELES